MEVAAVVRRALDEPFAAPEWVKPPFDGGFYIEMQKRHASEELAACEEMFEGDWLLRAAAWLRSLATFNGPPQGSFHHVCMVHARALEALSEAGRAPPPRAIPARSPDER